jgi:hypothetical protein
MMWTAWYSTLKAPEAQSRIDEFCLRVERQRCLIVKSDRTTNDAISAEIVLESLLVSLFLCINDRLRRPVGAGSTGNPAMRRRSPQVGASAEEPKSAHILLFPRIARHGGENPMAPTDENKKQPSRTAIEPDFRPLTAEERNEFMNSLSAEAKKLLAGLGSEKRSPKPAAAHSEPEKPRSVIRLL